MTSNGTTAMTLSYLASPYSGTHDQRRERFLEARRFVVASFKDGVHVLSPIMIWHEASLRFDLPTDAAAYANFNHALFRACASLLVLKLPGWEKSAGIAMEIGWACVACKHIREVTIEGNQYAIRGFVPQPAPESEA